MASNPSSPWPRSTLQLTTATDEPAGSPVAYAGSPDVRFPLLDRESLSSFSMPTAVRLAGYGLGSACERSVTVASLPHQLQIPPQAIVLVSGPSGSGKSLSLPLVLHAMGDPTPITPTPLWPDLATVDQWPDQPVEESIRLLTRVGLGDPFVWGRKPGTLSVGQRQRFDLARAMLGQGTVLVCDEWLSGLDQLTARAVASTVGRTCRTLGIGAVLVCSRPELEPDLEADVHIRVRFGAEPEIVHRTSVRGCSTIVAECRIARGNTSDWKRLKPLHYAAGDPATVHSVWIARHPSLVEPAAVAVFSWPDLHSAARNLATGDRYICRNDPAAVRQLNREVLKLSRIVVTPELRGIGLARRLVAEAIGSVRVRYIECVTALGREVGFLEALGFREVVQTPSVAEGWLMDWASRMAPPPACLLSPAALLAWVDGLSVRHRREGRRIIWAVYHQLVLWRRSGKAVPKKIASARATGWLEAADVACRRLVTRPAYWVLGPLDQLTGLPDPPPAGCPDGVTTRALPHMGGTGDAQEIEEPLSEPGSPAEGL